MPARPRLIRSVRTGRRLTFTALGLLAGLAVWHAHCVCRGPTEHAPGGRDEPVVGDVGTTREALRRAHADREIAATADRRGRARLLVHLEPTADRRGLRRLLGRRGARLAREFRLLPHLAAVRDFPVAALAALRAHPGVVALEPDRPLRPLLYESLELIHADEDSRDPDGPDGPALPWDGTGQVVCTVDTGIDRDHPCFAPLGEVVADEWDLVECDPEDQDPGCPDWEADDEHGHGTAMAGVVGCRAVQDDLSPPEDYPGRAKRRSVAPGVQFAVARVADASGMAWSSDFIAGIDWCVSSGADVILIGLGTLDTNMGDCDWSSLAQAVNAAVDAGVPTVVPAGDSFPPTGLSEPACASRALAVGATADTAPGEVAPWSSRGPSLDLVAPGTNIRAAALVLGGGEGEGEGEGW